MIYIPIKNIENTAVTREYSSALGMPTQDFLALCSYYHIGSSTNQHIYYYDAIYDSGNYLNNTKFMWRK
jgi:hypothetical protein